MAEKQNTTSNGRRPPSNGLTIFVVLGLPIVLTFLAMLWLLSLMMWGR